MKIKMPQKFDPKQYKPLEELFRETKDYSFTTILNYDGLVYHGRKEYIIIPSKENEPNLEFRIEVGNGDQKEDPGKKVKITGYVRYRGLVGIESFTYQFDLLPNPGLKEDYVRCLLIKRDKIRSMVLLEEIGFNSINPEKCRIVNSKKNNSTNPTKSKTNSQDHNPIIIYGTVQDDGGIYIEIDAAKIGRNSIVYHKEENKIGIRNRGLIQE